MIAVGTILQWRHSPACHGDSSTLDRRPDLVIVNKKGKWWLLDLLVQWDHTLKLKESEKLNKYLDLTREGPVNWGNRIH